MSQRQYLAVAPNWVLLGCLCMAACRSSHAAALSAPSSRPAAKPILVIGSLNMDVIIEVDRLPGKHETLTARSPRTTLAVGGKGANQAVAVARLGRERKRGSPAEDGNGDFVRSQAQFVCQFGNDAYATMLESTLVANGVDVSRCGHSSGLPSGQGIVLLEADGSVSSVVVGGSNTAWGQEAVAGIEAAVRDGGAGSIVMLQREVPEAVNEAAALAAAAAGVLVIQDVGGEDRPISSALLRLIDYLCPNESELGRLTGGLPTASDAQVEAAARLLVERGARNVLLTLGSRGAMLVSRDGTVLRQAALPVPGGVVVDATGELKGGRSFTCAASLAIAACDTVPSVWTIA